MPTQPSTRPSIAELTPLFQQLLPAAVIRQLVQASGQTFYERLWTPLVLVWCLIYQRLNAEHSCDAVVAYVATGALDGWPDRHSRPLSERLGSESTSAYCQGRNRLPLSVLAGALQHTSRTIEGWGGAAERWQGRQVALLDGSTLRLRPSAELVAHYGQHANQHGRLYWLVVRLVVVFSLSTGAVLGVSEAPVGQSEQALAWGLLAQAEAGWLYLADGNFGVFSIACAVAEQGSDLLVRLARSRARQLAGGALRPGDDRPVLWRRSPQDQLPPGRAGRPVAGRLIYVRLLRPGYRPLDLYLFSSLGDRQRYPLADLVALYGQRWQVELNLRDVKSRLALAQLASQTPEMLRKELYAGLLAYNLIRACMLQAAQSAGLSPLGLSFSACWQRVASFLALSGLALGLAARGRPLALLLARLAHCRQRRRPRFRLEPRAVRRRPLRYAYLKGSRTEARQQLRQQLAAPSIDS